MKKGKPATLTSALLARKGEAEPARLSDGSVPKDVMALHEEIVARLASELEREAGVNAPPEGAATAVDGVTEDLEDTGGMVAAEEAALEPAEDAPAMPDLAVEETSAEAPPTGDAGVPAGPTLGSAAPAGLEPQYALSDWADRPGRDADPVVYERFSAPAPRERARLLPIVGALLIVGIGVLFGLSYIDHGGPEAPPLESRDVGTAPVAAVPDDAPASPTPPVAVPPAAKAPPPSAAKPAQPAAPAPTKSSAGLEKLAAAGEPPPAPQAAAEPKPAASPRTPPVANAPYAVQLMSAVSDGPLEKEWTRVAAAFGPELGDRDHVITRADLGAKGIFYRLQVVGFSSVSEARDTCQALKAKNQACLVVKR